MRRLATPSLLLLAVLLAGCVYYPTIPDIGGIRIRPKESRAVRQADGFAIYMEIENSGGYEDFLLGITSDAARVATLVNVPAAQGTKLEIPAATTVSLKAEGPHILVSDLAKPLRSGDVFILTLVFEKLGRIGAITRVE